MSCHFVAVLMFFTIKTYNVVILFKNSERNKCISERDVTRKCSKNKMSTMSCIFITDAVLEKHSLEEIMYNIVQNNR